ncbi:aminopeptidase [Aquabacterium sp. OR-4]|uniref:aminopeptidase n=1 Tax=Aquabacterium sp. OR-4 TaxID=2978127 RepID=UPI0021B44538|nr:aminopeptidase [Aquabacterium sp. OR-4]MDT7837522.1 aminopeptidase [Aquabacterium sp. OR-4]
MPAAQALRRRRRGLTLALGAAVAAVLLLGSGCATVGYYAQSVGGHLAMLRQARPIGDWLADPATPAALRERLALAQQIRRYAVSALALPDNASYRRYAELGRGAAVWNVVAAPELSLTLKTWCYPVMGCVGYRGYFDRGAAEAEAQALRRDGWEAWVYGVPAYSTLGWTNWLGGDPLLNTFVRGSENELARLVFHELAHQVVFAAGDTEFNESYATAVERLGLARWQADAGRLPDDPAVARRRHDFRQITHRTRAALQALYASAAPEAERRARKAEILAAMRAEHAALKAGGHPAWAGFDGYDPWFANANNATLALQASYDGLVPAFERLFAREGSDFGRFHAAVQRLADLPRDQRHATLRALGP